MIARDRLYGTFAAAALLAPLAAQTDEEKEFDRTPVDCVTISRISKTEILDDQTVLFFMRGNKQIYQNHLPRKCPNLESEDRFGYRVSSSRLCKVDMITVLPRVGIPTTCRLGEFIPISAEEVDELRGIHDHGSRGDGVEVKPADPKKKDAAANDAAPKDAEPAQ